MANSLSTPSASTKKLDASKAFPSLLLFRSNPIFRSTDCAGSRSPSLSLLPAHASIDLNTERASEQGSESLVRSRERGRAGERKGGRLAAEDEFVSRPLHLRKKGRTDHRKNERATTDGWMGRGGSCRHRRRVVICRSVGR